MGVQHTIGLKSDEARYPPRSQFILGAVGPGCGNSVAGRGSVVVTTDVQIAFVATAVFTDLGRRYILTEHRKSAECSHAAYCKFRLRALLFPTLFLGPAAMVFMQAWPAWETQYWTARMDQTLGNGYNAMVAGVFLAALVLAALLGNWLGFLWVTKGRVWSLRLVYLAVLAATVLAVLVRWPAAVRLGTVSQFRTHPASLPFIWQDNAFLLMFLLVSAYAVLPLIVFAFRIRRESARCADMPAR